MTVSLDSIRAGFAAIVGESRVVAERSGCAAYSVDGKTPQCAVYAPSADAVARVLKHASEHDLAAIPLRNLTKIGTGNPPRRYDVALSLKEMNRVWYYEPDDLTVSVEPGMKLGDLQHLLSRHNLWLPLDPPGGEKASIGGILATNASGPLRLRYGTPRDFTIGMKIATTEGKIINTGGRVVKNVAGYDIAKLAIGSYGTLGVIVEASFKLFPMPAATATFVLTASTLDKAREVRRDLERSPLEPMRTVLLDSGYVQPIQRNQTRTASERNWQIWLEAGGSDRVLDRYERELAELARRTGTALERPGPDAETACAWSEITGRDAHSESSAVECVLKVSLPIAATEEFMGRALQVNPSAEPRLALSAYAAVGIVYIKLSPTAGEKPSVELIEHLRALALELSGSLIIERAPLEMKNRVDTWGATGDDFAMMRQVKSAWDPKGILSPGRFVGGL